ncbi:MAG TPA: acyl-CoA dehydrogenase family protein [Solirubrobacteraceae bacterium]|jgi:acyl-CoA dehydrogenase|nr:acyl-CoA dehydrogenase family protein [Solirubrobacteraceae bacterium]
MDFEHSPRARELLARLDAFIAREVAPREEPYHRELLAREDPWIAHPAIAELKAKARAEGLWNLFLPGSPEVGGEPRGAGLTNVEYAPLAERMGRSLIASEVCNCNAPDTGNMEVLLHFGSSEQQERYLVPLLDGEIRSAFCMTEPDVASADAANMQATAMLEGDEVVLNGRKWWSTGVGHPNCRVAIFMGLTDPTADRYHQHSMVAVPLDTPGVKVERMLAAMGFDDAPGGHGEVSFTDVRLPASAIVGGPGQAFAIAQARLGPGRIHHCMRLIGLAELALELACRRATERVAFGKPLANLGGNRERIADARIAIDQARLHVLHAAWLIDQASNPSLPPGETGPPGGRAGGGQWLGAVSQIKVAVPNMAQRVVDMAMQLHGGAGLSNDFPLGAAWTVARALRLADGPDEVHRGVIARLELASYGQGKWGGAST